MIDIKVIHNYNLWPFYYWLLCSDYKRLSDLNSLIHTITCATRLVWIRRGSLYLNEMLCFVDPQTPAFKCLLADKFHLNILKECLFHSFRSHSTLWILFLSLFYITKIFFSKPILFILSSSNYVFSLNQ